MGCGVGIRNRGQHNRRSILRYIYAFLGMVRLGVFDPPVCWDWPPSQTTKDGSCIPRVQPMNDKAHSLNNGAVDPFRVRHCFVGCHISSQMLLVHAAECSQVRAQSGACSLTAIAMDLANAISIIIYGPLSTTVARSPIFDRRVVGLEFCFDCRIPTPFKSLIYFCTLGIHEPKRHIRKVRSITTTVASHSTLALSPYGKSVHLRRD